MNVHTLDPVTSYEARDAAERYRWTHMDAVMQMVAQKPGLTSSEYAILTGLDVVETRRRLTDAKNEGHAYQDGAYAPEGKRRRECQWWPVEAQGSLW